MFPFPIGRFVSMDNFEDFGGVVVSIPYRKIRKNATGFGAFGILVSIPYRKIRKGRRGAARAAALVSIPYRKIRKLLHRAGRQAGARFHSL